MGKSYYCEFCDKVFRDVGTNRRNHMRSVNHQRLKREYYDSFKDIPTIIAEESLKVPCQTFFRRGHCDFGERCKYSHMTPERKAALERQVLTQKAKEQAKAEDFGSKVDKWLSRMNSKYGGSTDSSKQEAAWPELPAYRLPSCLVGIANLPPSVLPPPPDALKGVTLEDWG